MKGIHRFNEYDLVMENRYVYELKHHERNPLQKHI